MAVAALTALVAVILDHGLLLGASWELLLQVVEAVCGLLFGGLQAAKLLVVDRPGEYLRSHRLDFSLLFVLLFQVAGLAALAASPEQRYLVTRGLPSPVSLFYVVVLQLYLVLIVGLRSPWLPRFLLRLRLRPVQVMVASFLLLIGLGTLLLALPGANADGRPLPLVDALFTSTSAVCVTGLVVRDTGTQFSSLGLATLLGLIQAGGLGMLTITTSFALFGGRELSAEESRSLASAMGVERDKRVSGAAVRVFGVTLLLEALGASALFALWGDVVPDPVTRGGWAIFHAVSAFCNAGFALFANHASLTQFGTSASTLAVIAALIVMGGLGFGVLGDTARQAGSRQPRVTTIARHSRWVLGTTGFLLVSGSIAFWLTERQGALSAFVGTNSWLGAVFQSVTLRTAGFHTFDVAAFGLPATALCIVLMLVGGSPASTAGGMKTTTCAVAAIGWFRPARVERALARRALALAGAFLGVWVALVVLLATLEGGLDRRIAFEAASALGTVGLTMGVTEELSTASKVLVAVAMFVGRVGPFAFAASLLPAWKQAEEGSAPQRILLG
jgi:Trk-type K+ transport system membrane component